MSDSPGTRAVRIELATSELEGGCYRAWADPGQVLTVLALGSPHDVFERAVEPRLRELGAAGSEESAADAGPSSAPPLVGQLVRRLHEIHTRLYRDNRSLMREPRWVELTCALAEEDRIFFLKGAPAYICLLRDEQAFPAGRMAANEAEAGGSRLGRAEDLNLELTSLAVRPGDTVVVLSSDPDLPPDLQAIRNLFQRTTDLKRACDGLVNLLGLQAQGAAAVAFRFVPVGASAEGSAPRTNLLEELAAEFAEMRRSPAQGNDAASGTPATPALETERPGEREGAPAVTPVIAGELPSKAAPIAAETSRSRSAPEPSMPSVQQMASTLPMSSTPPIAASRTVAPAAPRPRGWRRFWPVLLVLALLSIVLFVALPGSGGGGGRGGLFSALTRGGGEPDIGSLEILSSPPAEGVLLNGARVAEGTPARIDSIPSGRQRIGLDLGPSGIWETDVEIRPGARETLTPTLRGSIEVAAEDPAAGGRVWTQGRSKRAIPTVLDSLSVGWNRVFYEDSDVPLWDRLVLVKADRVTRIVVPNRRRVNSGLVKVEGLLYQEREGLVESTGDSVWVDGVASGRTPCELALEPGLHSVRVGSAATGYSSEVLDVMAGSLRHVQAQLGGAEQPVLRHRPPGSVLVRGPVLLTATVTGTDAARALRPTLHVPALGLGSREIPMTPVEGTPGAFVGALQPETLPLGRALRYYFSVVAPDGRIVSSDLYRLRAYAEWPAQADASESAPAPEDTVATVRN